MANDLWDQKSLYAERFGGRCQACAHPDPEVHQHWCPIKKDYTVSVDPADECDSCRQWEQWAAQMPKSKHGK